MACLESCEARLSHSNWWRHASRAVARHWLQRARVALHARCERPPPAHGKLHNGTGISRCGRKRRRRVEADDRRRELDRSIHVRYERTHEAPINSSRVERRTRILQWHRRSYCQLTSYNNIVAAMLRQINGEKCSLVFRQLPLSKTFSSFQLE